MSSLLGKSLIKSTLLSLLVFIAFHTNAEQTLMMSDKKAAKIGQEMYDEVTAQIPVVTDKKITDYVNKVGQNIARHSDEPDDKYIFTVCLRHTRRLCVYQPRPIGLYEFREPAGSGARP